MQKRRTVIGNWKMYVESPKEAKNFARALRRRAALFAGVEAVIAPSFPLIPAVAEALKGSKIPTGAQTLSAYESGAHTGEVPAAALKSLGASLVIVGHSERRAAGETDEQVREQVRNAVHAGLQAVLCVGEKERDAAGNYFEILSGQLSSALAGFPKTAAGKLIIAYEPVWAIGKEAGDAMKSEELRETVIFIRKTIADILGREALSRVAILYGGSVEPENAPMLIKDSNISGFLVGHASADMEKFLQILKVCKK